ncbi:MAG TPA: LysR family transcriptional regulator [Candidatus Lachnoclostridium pullistercoris]|uniref:LysR family transcriptional regulator n=1 Tax=Candidatus Lachnoclostridium pullistercoris TaxID=2838632 RepID=A0A9D2PC70_9FIRM|nr:LysR family transcriptional regulator [Candidatus Lachnoclostridium pullistercoris]
MDLRQIENIVAIEQEQSISRAAEKLFLTQSALNQQLLRLEKELGVPLFERRKHTMIPTFAGKIYLATAHRMIDMKKETYKIIQDISDENAGEISVAYSPEKGSLMFSHIYPIFRRRYPNVTFSIHEAHVKKMESMLLQKDVTLACITRTDKICHPDIEYVDTLKELMVLALPSSHPLARLAGSRSWETFPPLDLTLLRNESFALVAKTTRMRSMIDDAFRAAGFIPKVLFESSSTATVVNMVKNQVCPAFFPQSYVDPAAPMVYFSTQPKQYWFQTVAYLKGEYLTKPEKYFIELVKQYSAGRKG